MNCIGIWNAQERVQRSRFAMAATAASQCAQLNRDRTSAIRKSLDWLRLVKSITNEEGRSQSRAGRMYRGTVAILAQGSWPDWLYSNESGMSRKALSEDLR